jgi:hypothetical protein
MIHSLFSQVYLGVIFANMLIIWSRIFKLVEEEDNMQKIRYMLIVMWMLVCTVISAEAQMSIGIGLPNVSIGIGLPNVSLGINVPYFPELVPIPGYPVYYAPEMDANYFFYDGMYWVYQDDNWYASSWYNGPWGFVEPEDVPLYILRIPVHYYQQPPEYFREWRSNAPPRWGQHWGRGWEQRRRGWDRWNRGSASSRAPLPVYQRQYSGDRYPRVEQQHTLRSQSYRYQPRDRAVREHYRQQQEQRAIAPDQRQQRNQRQQNPKWERRDQRQQNDQRQQQQNDQKQHDEMKQHRDQRQEREQQAPRAQEREQRLRDRGEPQEPNRGRQGQDRDEERGRGRD